VAAGYAQRPCRLPPLRVTKTIWLDPRARVLIEQETLKRPRVETGGALFGYEDGESVVVGCAYGPGPRAKHRPTSFEPHSATTRALMDAVRTASGCRYRYLGSWHSHPGGAACPSAQDAATARLVAREPQVLLPQPILLIQASLLGSAGVTLAELGAWRLGASDALERCEISSVQIEVRRCPPVKLRWGVRRRRHVLSPEPS
jgi:integrative and conjugative element protein (TIGR02256 family)